MTTASPRYSAALIEKVGPFDLGVLTHSRTGAFLAFAFGLVTFLPYPAIPAGRNSAIQAGNILTLLMVLPCLSLAWHRRSSLLYPMLLLPLVLGTLKVLISGTGSSELALKVLPLWAVSLLAMVVTQLYAPRYALHMMLGIATAAVMHVGVGMWQLHSFSSGQLPLVEVYINPSFLTVKDRARIIALYIQRPFGLFPEPSAMASCLAPWVLLWMANLFGLVRFKCDLKNWHKVLFTVAALGSLLLIVLSRSGHAIVVVACAAVLFLAWLRRAPATARTYGLLVLVIGIVAPALILLTANAMQDRVSDSAMGNDSWEDRANSLMLGFRFLVGGSGSTLIFGLGSGQTANMLWNLTGLDAVWSVLLTYIYETGVIGAMVVSWVGWQLFAQWRITRAKLVFGLVFGVWLVGITVTTSYAQLLPLWLFLGWLTVWPELCDGPEEPTAARPVTTRNRFIPVRTFPRRPELVIPRETASSHQSTEALP